MGGTASKDAPVADTDARTIHEADTCRSDAIGESEPHGPPGTTGNVPASETCTEGRPRSNTREAWTSPDAKKTEQQPRAHSPSGSARQPASLVNPDAGDLAVTEDEGGETQYVIPSVQQQSYVSNISIYSQASTSTLVSNDTKEKSSICSGTGDFARRMGQNSDTPQNNAARAIIAAYAHGLLTRMHIQESVIDPGILDESKVCVISKATGLVYGNAINPDDILDNAQELRAYKQRLAVNSNKKVMLMSRRGICIPTTGGDDDVADTMYTSDGGQRNESNKNSVKVDAHNPHPLSQHQQPRPNGSFLARMSMDAETIEAESRRASSIRRANSMKKPSMPSTSLQPASLPKNSSSSPRSSLSCSSAAKGLNQYPDDLQYTEREI